MRALGIETATPIASAAVVDGDGVLAERTVPVQGSHARTLLPLIDDVLAAAAVPLRSLDLLAVSIGPGSFTGLRIGLSAAKGLALATGLPVVAVPTLAAYARAAGRRGGVICPVLDARRGEVYAAAFRWAGAELVEVAGPAAMAPERFAAIIEEPCTMIGDGVDAYFATWQTALNAERVLIRVGDLAPSAAVVARVGIARAAVRGADDAAELVPAYCRSSEAERVRSARADAAFDGMAVHCGKIDRG